jgi:type II secretory pathway component GspD/PulD (secretin)
MNKLTLCSLVLLAPLGAVVFTTPACIGVAHDQPHAREVITLKYASAADIKAKLTKLYMGEGILVESDDRTNSVIVVASKDRFAEIEKLVAKLDIEVK